MTSKLVPSTARTRPSSSAKETRRSRTESSGVFASAFTASSMTIRIGGTAQPGAHKVEGEHGHDDDEGRGQEPGGERQGLDVLRLLQEHAPADRRRGGTEGPGRGRGEGGV